MSNKRRTLTDKERLINIDKKIEQAEQVIVAQQKIIADLKAQRGELESRIMQKEMKPIFDVMRSKGISAQELIAMISKDQTVDAVDKTDENDGVISATKDDDKTYHVRGSIDDILG